jgi:hypothetical protein
MKDCRRCGASIDDAAQFCPDCGAPQSDAARAELADLAREELEPSQLPSGDGGGGGPLLGAVGGDPDTLLDRVAYAVGFVTLVLALALLFDPAAVPLFLAGLVILPPMRYLLARPFGRPFIREFMLALYAVFAVVGGVLFVLL